MKATSKGMPVSVVPLKLAHVTSIRQSIPSLSDDCRASIDSLEYLLGLARQNRLPGLMFVAVELNPDDSARNVTSGITGEAGKDQVINMLGMLTVLQKDLFELANL